VPAAGSARHRVAAVAWALAFVVVGYFAVTNTVTVLFGFLASRASWLADGPVGPSLIQAAVGVGVFWPLSWLIGRRRLKLTPDQLGWAPSRVGVQGFGKGFIVAIAIGAVAVIAGLPANSTWVFDGGTLAEYFGRLLTLALVLLPAALFEELAFRGVLVAGLIQGLGRVSGVGVGAVLFALAHRNNPGVTPLALGNIALAGIFLGATFLARGGLWTATGAHLGWNLALAGSGAAVSGLPFEIPWVDFIPGEPSWLTGGLFGPEGGLLATGALVLGTVVVVRWPEFREAR